MRQELRDSNRRLIGVITTANGKMEGRDGYGRLKGKYDPKSNRTFDSYGRDVGKGNLLAALVNSALS